MKCFFTVVVAEPTMAAAVAADTALLPATHHLRLGHKQSVEQLEEAVQQETAAAATALLPQVEALL
jgi:hypothetical protein